MLRPSRQKLAEWKKRATQKKAIVPFYFEVSPEDVFLICGNCNAEFQRKLIPNVNEPTFVCPNKTCSAKNWVPVKFKLRH